MRHYIYDDDDDYDDYDDFYDDLYDDDDFYDDGFYDDGFYDDDFYDDDFYDTDRYDDDIFDGKVHREDGPALDGYTVDASGANFPVRMLDGNIEVNRYNVVTDLPEGDVFPSVAGKGNPYLGHDGDYYDFTNIPENVQLAGWFYDNGGTWTRLKVGDRLPAGPLTIRANYRITTLTLNGCKDNNISVPAGGEFKVPSMSMTHRWTLTNQDADRIPSGQYFDATTHTRQVNATWGNDGAIGLYGYDVRDRLLDGTGRVYDPFQFYNPTLNRWIGVKPFTDEDLYNSWYANSLDPAWDVTFKADPRLPEGTVIHFRVTMPSSKTRPLDDESMRPNVGSFTVTIGGGKSVGKEPSTITFTPAALTLVEGSDPVNVTIGGVGDGELGGGYEDNGVLEVTSTANGLSVRPLKAGTCTITISRAETDRYEAATATLTVTVTTRQEGDTLKPIPGYLPLYRVYNRDNTEHLYTTDPNEYSYLTTHGWTGEDVAWTAPAKSNTPIYRLLNPATGEHHYTADFNEYTYQGTHGWNREDVAFYASDATDGRPVYRLYRGDDLPGAHHFTTEANERDVLQRNGWTLEGIAWYAPAD